MSTNFANRLFIRAPWRAIAAASNGVHSSLAQTRTVVCRSSALVPPPASSLNTSTRSFSYDAGKGGSRRMTPSYQVYGEESALTIKTMLPGFKALGSSSMVLDTKRRGRLLIEWTPRNPDGKQILYYAVALGLSSFMHAHIEVIVLFVVDVRAFLVGHSDSFRAEPGRSRPSHSEDSQARNCGVCAQSAV